VVETHALPPVGLFDDDGCLVLVGLVGGICQTSGEHTAHLLDRVIAQARTWKSLGAPAATSWISTFQMGSQAHARDAHAIPRRDFTQLLRLPAAPGATS